MSKLTDYQYDWNTVDSVKLNHQQTSVTEPSHDKTNKMACAPSKDSDQPGHSPSLIRDFAVRMKKDWVLSYTLSAQRKLWSDWADAQADLSLHWAHSHFVVLSWGSSYKCIKSITVSTIAASEVTNKFMNYAWKWKIKKRMIFLKNGKSWFMKRWTEVNTLNMLMMQWLRINEYVKGTDG